MGGVKFHHLWQTQSLHHISMIPCHACCYRMVCLKIMYIRLKKSSVIYIHFYCLRKYHYIFHVQFETVGPSLADSFCVIASLPSANNIFTTTDSHFLYTIKHPELPTWSIYLQYMETLSLGLTQAPTVAVWRCQDVNSWSSKSSSNNSRA